MGCTRSSRALILKSASPLSGRKTIERQRKAFKQEWEWHEKIGASLAADIPALKKLHEVYATRDFKFDGSFTSRSMDVHVSRLRKYLKDDRRGETTFGRR